MLQAKLGPALHGSSVSLLINLDDSLLYTHCTLFKASDILAHEELRTCISEAFLWRNSQALIHLLSPNNTARPHSALPFCWKPSPRNWVIEKELRVWSPLHSRAMYGGPRAPLIFGLACRRPSRNVFSELTVFFQIPAVQIEAQRSSSQPGTVLPPRGYLAISEDEFSCHK